MTHVIVRDLLHIVFATEERRMLIPPAIQDRLHAYMATVGRNCGCQIYRVGGIDNHIHILCGLSGTIAISDLVSDLKRAASAWLKQQGEVRKTFRWQRGYAAFSTCPERFHAPVEYISNQRSHHHQTTFREEYRKFLQETEIDYDDLDDND